MKNEMLNKAPEGLKRFRVKAQSTSKGMGEMMIQAQQAMDAQQMAKQQQLQSASDEGLRRHLTASQQNQQAMKQDLRQIQQQPSWWDEWKGW